MEKIYIVFCVQEDKRSMQQQIFKLLLIVRNSKL